MLKVLLLAALLGLCSCAQTTKYERPTLPVPNQWDDAFAPHQKNATKTHWRVFFSDPQLQRLIAIALKNNRDLRIAAGRVEEARAQFGITRADLGPTFNLMGSGNLTTYPANLSGTGMPLTSRRFDLSVSAVSFEVDFWGRVANLTEAARMSYLSTEESRRSVYLSLVADVAQAYLTVIQMGELIDLERSTVLLRDESLNIIKKGQDLGGANDFEYQQARGMLESAQSELAGYEHQKNVARNKLNFLLGDASFDLKTGATLDDIGPDFGLAAGLPADVLLLRPDVMAAEQRLMAAHANIDAARAAFLPKVVLTASLGAASEGLLSLFAGRAWSFMPSLTMPLFDGGRTAAGLDLAQARKVIAVAEYERSIQVAFREVADLLSARASLAQQVKSSNARVQVSARRLEIAKGRFDAGVGGYLDVLDAQREVIAALQTAAQVRLAQLESNVQLYKALGGGQGEVG
ncbi:efflux transporter outer membrane subunit [Rhodoferax sp.]|uniref:efflux transporter outer membrane subunit n=1 Tax=Rhodoferax sp. TaxID=50421 RepID=UPI0028419425|nr:efflux transporter outer membrane subunit [Rhodoferax sp.]MDR3371400.1 efflux transporter outer membrane subunit [Rhodoferax sp.]